MNSGLYDHDSPPPADPPLPDKSLDQLQVVEARHVLLYVAQEAQGLRTALGAMYARTDQQRLITTEKVVHGIQALIDDLESLRETLGGTPGLAMHYLTADGLTLCRQPFSDPVQLTRLPAWVTCKSCATILRARERNEH
jgi:hypothetical protein